MDLIIQIQEEIASLEKEEENERFLYFQTLFKKFNPLKPGNCNDLTEGEWLALLFLAMEPSITEEEARQIGTEIDSFKKNEMGNSAHNFFVQITKCAEYFEKNQIQENVALDDSALKFAIKVAKVIKPKDTRVTLAKKFYDYKKRNRKVMEKWLQLLTFKDSYNMLMRANDEKRRSGTNEEILHRAVNKVLKEIKQETNYQAIIEMLQAYQSSTQKEEEKKKKQRRSKMQTYEKVLKKLQQGEKLNKIDPDWKDLSLPIQMALVSQVLETLQVKEHVLKEEKEKIQKHALVHTLLIDQVHPSILVALEKEDFLDEALKRNVGLLRDAHFPIGTIQNIEVLKSLLKADFESLQNMLSYFKTNAISLDFLTLHKEILSSKKQETKEIFDLLQQESIDFKNATYQENILLSDPERIKARILLSKNYGLNLAKEPTLFPLQEEAYFDLIDFALENELPLLELIKIKGNKEDLENVMKRFKIASCFGLETVTKEDTIPYSIETGSSFFIPTAKLDDVIENSTPFEQDPEMKKVLDRSSRLEISFIDSYLETKNDYLDEEKECYNFNQVLISKNKVLRNRSVLKRYFPDRSEEDIFYQAVIYHTMLTSTQLSKIKAVIKPKQKRIP